jgi:hypothetical protein
LTDKEKGETKKMERQRKRRDKEKGETKAMAKAKGDKTMAKE